MSRFFREKDFRKDWIVGEDVWSVKFSRDLDKDADSKENESTLGLTDPSEMELLIKQKQTPRLRMSCFIHELLHAMEDSYNIEISHKAVYQLEKAIMNFLLVNKII